MATRTARSRRRDPRRVGSREREKPGRAVVVEQACAAGCGSTARLEVPGDAPASMRRIAEGIRDSRSLKCGPCGDAEDREREYRESAERHAGVVAGRRERAGIPALWRAQGFDALEDDEDRRRALLRSVEWSRGDVRGVLLWGLPGRGKSAIAAAAANRRLDRGPARWLTIPELMIGLRMPFDSREYSAALRQLTVRRSGSPLALVLDDVDKSKATEHAIEPIFQLVNAWIELEWPLLVTVNRNLDELREWWPETFAEPLVSRLSGYCKIQHVGGRDRRLD